MHISKFCLNLMLVIIAIFSLSIDLYVVNMSDARTIEFCREHVIYDKSGSLVCAVTRQKVAKQ